MVFSAVRYIEVPDCPQIPDHPAWWVPSIWGGVIVGVAFCIMCAVIAVSRHENNVKIKRLEFEAKPDLDLDWRLKKVESYVGGSGP